MSVRCCINDLIYEMSLLRVYCHLFHCKRGFNLVNRCQYCASFFVDDVSFSKHIACVKCFFWSLFFNVHYTGVVKSVENDVLLSSCTNFGTLFYDIIVTTFSLYHFYLEIYVRLFFNLMRKKSTEHACRMLQQS